MFPSPPIIKIIVPFWSAVRYFLYYTFSFIYIFYKKYLVSECFVNTTAKTDINEVKVYDTGIMVGDVVIPYEHILHVRRSTDYIILLCLAKIENDTIVMGDSKLYIKLYTPMPRKLMYDIVNNMYYHLKYHQVNFDVLNYSVLEKES